MLRQGQTADVHRLIAWQFGAERWSRGDYKGRQMRKAHLKLYGWSFEHPVLVVRSCIRGGIVRKRMLDGARQPRMGLYPSKYEDECLWGYAAVVTNFGCPIEEIGQHYRELADAENGFGELQTPRGLDGFATQDLARRQAGARTRSALVLAHIGWAGYFQAAHLTVRREAITHRPLRLSRGGRRVSHAGQSTLLKSPTASIETAVWPVRATAGHFGSIDPWTALVRYVAELMAPRSAACSPAGRSRRPVNRLP